MDPSREADEGTFPSVLNGSYFGGLAVWSARALSMVPGSRSFEIARGTQRPPNASAEVYTDALKLLIRIALDLNRVHL